ncbi:MAG TPA: Ldh family oxidoreductase [Paenirhodobacter sp.]
MTQTTPFTIAQLTQTVAGIFAAAGVTPAGSAALADVIVHAERDACKSHGVYRIEGCLRTIKAGKTRPDSVPRQVDGSGAIIRIDAQGGFSPVAFRHGLPALVERTRELGLAALVINDCTHFSALWHEVEALTAQGLAGLAMCPSYATVAPTGGLRPLLGTNPLAFGWPRAGTNPYVFDFATSMAARGEIELHRRAGTPLPAGWALDADGLPTTDPQAALNGAMLPFGGHKGSAISTMIELLAGAMIGDFLSPEALDWLGTTSLAPRHGELILAFDPARFAAGRGDPLAHAETLFTDIVGQGARLPSQRRFDARARALTDGIVLDAAEVALLDRLQRDGLAAV